MKGYFNSIELIKTSIFSIKSKRKINVVETFKEIN